MTCMPIATRFSDWVVPQLTSSGCFGPSCKIVKFEIDTDHKGEDQFSSTVQFFKLTTEINGILRPINVLVKFQPEGSQYRSAIGGRDQFLNELFMYKELIPMIDKNGTAEDIFCKFIHGTVDVNKSDDTDCIVLEDLSKHGYRMSQEKVFLDYDHIILALKAIGRFHALSYSTKEKNYPQFKEAVLKLREKWNFDRLIKRKHLLHLCGQRGILPLIENVPKHANLLKEFLKNYEDPCKFYASLVDPTEPDAVLCHGDFCRNNMLFAYNDTGKPVSVKLFDLQLPRYSSPVTDLSFFLLMNADKNTRETYWDEFINIYKDSVKSAIPDIVVPELNFSKFAVYGYLHCSFFLPMMLADPTTHPPLSDILSLPPYELGVAMSQVGGEEETRLLVDIFQFLLSRGYIREKYY